MTAAIALEVALSTAADAALNHPFYLSDRGDCGSAWIVLPQAKGRKALLAALASEHAGIRVSRHHAGGYAVHILCGIRNQSRAIKEAGCDAFAAALERAGYKANVYSYAD